MSKNLRDVINDDKAISEAAKLSIQDQKDVITEGFEKSFGKLTPIPSDSQSDYQATTWEKATPKQMVKILTDKLNDTPKLKFIKRLHLRRNIEFWKGQL